MAFLMTRWLCAAATRLPFILLGSPPLRQTSALFEYNASQPVKPAEVSRQLTDITAALPRSRFGAAGAKTKDAKKRGFNAIIRWCAYHQDATLDALLAASSSAARDHVAAMDDAVLRWLQASTRSFSCGQSLVVLTFLCDVLQRLARVSLAAGDTEAAREGRIGGLLKCITLVLEHAVSSSHLELQPFTVLLSAAYALDRVTHGNPLQLPPAVLDSIQAPDALWFALVHQAKGHIAELEAAPPGAEDRTQMETLLTAMLLFDATRCSGTVASAEGKVLLPLMRAFVLLAREKVKAARQQRDAVTHVRNGQLSDIANVVTPHTVETLAEADTGAHPEDAAVSRALSRTAAPWGTISMADCERILGNMQVAASSDRVVLLEYLLLVARSPEAYTAEDLVQLPRVLTAVSAATETREAAVADVVLAGATSVSFEALLCVLPYVKNRRFMRRSIVALLDNNLARHAATAAAAAGGGASDEELTPTAARMVLTTLGLHLPWRLCRHLVVRMFAEYPGLHAAMLAALERRLDSQRAGDDNAAASSGEGTSADAKLLLSVEVGAAMVFLSEAPESATLMADTEAAQRQVREEVRVLTGVLIRHVDWTKSATVSARVAAEGPGPRFSTSSVRFAAMRLYVQDRLEHRFLRDEEAMSDDTLLQGYVWPALRAKSRSPTFFRTMSGVLQVLQHEASRKILLSRTLSCAALNNGTALREFVRYLAVPATELKVKYGDFTCLLFRIRNLTAGASKHQVPAKTDALKVHTIVLSRVLRYIIAIDAFGDVGADVAAMRLDAARGWFEHYMSLLASAESSAAEDAAAVDGAESATAAVTPANGAAGGEPVAAGEAAAASAVEQPEKESEDADGAAEEPPVLCDSTSYDDDLFTTPVTAADVEEVLSLILQVGCKAPFRVVQLWARRFSESHVALLEDAALDASEGTWSAVDEPAGDGAASPPLREPVDGGVEDGLAAAPTPQLLPAHFVWLVRTDSYKPCHLSPRLARSLLWRAELAILSHVFAALLQALKRARPVPSLREDLQVTATSFGVLHARLTEVTASHEAGHGSGVVRASLAALLRHLGHTRAYMTPAMQQIFRPHAALRDADVPVEKGPEEDLGLSDGAAESPVAGAAPPTAETPDEAGLVADAAVADGDEVDDVNGADELLALHAETEAAVLRTLPFLEPPHTKQLALSEFRRLAYFLPRVAPFLMHQLQPQLRDFTPRELLQLAAQYPAAAADVLASLAASDMHLTVDLAEYVTLARHLPASVNDAVVRAHLPHMTLVWVTRVLSALSARHEDVSLSLLRALVERAQATVDEGSESDKSLLLMVLQAYLGTGAASSATAPPAQGRTAEVGEDLKDTEVFPGPLTTSTVLLDAGERAARLELVRACCDRVLSLDHIATLEALRFFLVGYPPSLYQMRERGVVAKVEQRLLPDLLGATPPNAKDLAALVQLLAEHHVLLPSTVRQILESVYTVPVLRSMHTAAAANSDSEIVAALTSLLQVAAICACAATTALEPLLASVLRVFDGTHHWLAALGNLLASPSATPAVETASRYMCAALLQRGATLTPSEFARLLQCVSRLKAWDVALTPGSAGSSAVGGGATFDSTFASCYGRADAHSRCVLLRAIATDTAVLRRFEGIVFLPMPDDVALLSSEDVELVLAAVQQVSSELVAEPVLDAIDTRLLPMMDQCRRSALVRLLQCHAHFGIRDEAVVTAALQALERQSTSEVKLEASQVLAVLQAIAKLCETRLPVRLVVMCFQRLEKSMMTLTPVQQYQVGRLILDLEMGFIPCVSALVLHILDSRDSARGHAQFQAMAEELCSVFEVELPPTLRASRLRKLMHKQRVQDFWSAQRRVKEQALLHHRLAAGLS